MGIHDGYLDSTEFQTIILYFEMKRLHLIVFAFLYFPAIVFSQTPTGVISGTVINELTQQPLQDVNVVIVSTQLGSATDKKGQFRISNVPVGTHSLQITSLGFRPILVADVVVRSSRVTQVNKSLEEWYIETDEVVVEAGSYFETSSENLTSVQNLSYEEVRRSAGAIGDVLRLTQALPGVALTNDQRNDLVVRGGSPSENLVMVDGIEVPSLNHFGAQNTSGGPISMLNTEYLADASFYSGGFSSRYGNRLSSVLDITLHEGNRERFAADVEMGIAGFGASSEGPIGDRGAYMISLRRSYLELLQDAIGLTAVPEYWNLNAKVVYELDDKNKLSFVSLGGIDDIAFNVDPNDLEDPSLENLSSNGWQTINGFNWHHLISDRAFGVFTLSDAAYHYGTEIFDERVGNALTFRQDDNEGTTTARYDLTLLPEQLGEIRLGADVKQLRARYRLDQPLGVLSALSPTPDRVNPVSLDDRITTRQLGGYIELSPRISHNFIVNLGARADHYEFIDATRISPRASLRLSLFPNLNLNASWGQFYQSPALIFLNARPTNKNLKPIRSSHYVAGVSFFPRNDIRITIEGYIKEYEDYPVSTQFPSLTLANTGDDFGVAELLFPLSSEGSGISRGMEFYIQKKLTDRFYGQLSYSYSETEHEALDGIRRKASFDIPHTFTALAGMSLGKWAFSGKFTYASGRPYTPYLTSTAQAQNRAIFDLSQINAERAPAYHRLDIRVDRNFNFANWSILVFLDVLNVYNRENIQQYIWNPKTSERDIVPQYALLPNIGFNVKF